MTTELEVYRRPEEHEAIREAVRAVCDGKVAPNAAEADETGQFPQASYDALRAAVERMLRDAKITQIYEGTNQVQRIVMARQLLAR